MRHPRWLFLLPALFLPALALARVGGGEHYPGRDSGGDGVDGDLVAALIYLAIRHPAIGIPLIVVVGVAYLYLKHSGATARTQRALMQRDAELRTQVSNSDLARWVAALKQKDPSFEPLLLMEKVKRLFLQVQQAWFQRDLAPVRPFLSDSTFQRLTTQLRLLSSQGARDAIADVSVLEVQLIGLDQSEWFDTLHLRVKARARDTDVPEGFTDEQALAAARKVPPEAFTEVWSFVRKPGVKTRMGEDLYQGKCPNCGAPYSGGAANRCEYCGAVVNSGNYDWTLSEITQGIEHLRHPGHVPGLQEARRADPALNLEMLEDRTSLVFWKWIEAQILGDARRLAKLCTPDLLSRLESELAGKRKTFRECAVGAVITTALQTGGERDRAQVEVRWSARLGELPAVPCRWIFTLVRKAGAMTSTANGVSTSRCPSCNAPLSDSATSACDYCGADLAAGERDWVLSWAGPYEAFQASSAMAPAPGAQAVVLTGREERERLLFMMAAMAAADGTVDHRERKLLKLCAQRWSVPWPKVEQALRAGGGLFDRLVQKGSPEAEVFFMSLFQLATVDGAIDKKERQMLESAAAHLGLSPRLGELWRPPGG